MSDNLKRKAPEDPKKININQTWELDFWAKKFGVLTSEIISAVKAVGVYVVDVKKYLGK